MKLLTHPQHLILSSIVALSLLAPALSATTAMASSSMAGMAHQATDSALCLSQHNTPAAPVNKCNNRRKFKKAELPKPLRIPHYVSLQQWSNEPKKVARTLFSSASFRPPDKVILTANLRI